MQRSFFLLLCFVASALYASEETYLSFDPHTNELLPKNFRSLANQKIPEQELRFSGSGQFSPYHFKNILQQLKIQNGYFIDFRQESHGFIDEHAISWYGKNNAANKDYNLEDIVKIERKLLKAVKKKSEVTVYQRTKHRSKLKLIPQSVLTLHTVSEKDFLEKRGFKYVRFPIQDGKLPSDHEIDAFISFVQQLPKGTWVHFHCRSGRGRTTLFMLLYDIMHNAHHASLSQIRQRHTHNDQGFLFDKISRRAATNALNHKRRLLMKQFYNFSQANTISQLKWSGWCANLEKAWDRE